MANFLLGMRAVHQKNIQAAVSEAKHNGFNALEIHLSSPQFLPQNYPATLLKEIKNFAIEQNIILQIHAEIGQSLILADSIIRRAEKQRLKRLVEFGLALGARCLTLHPGAAPGYLSNHRVISNDQVYPKYYQGLFKDSLAYLASLKKENFYICVENTDNFNTGYQKILQGYLRARKLFLAWDIMKSFNFKPKPQLKKDQWLFLNRNLRYVKNIHISGPWHSGIKGLEKSYKNFFELLKLSNSPVIIETLLLKDVLETKKIIRNLGF